MPRFMFRQAGYVNTPNGPLRFVRGENDVPAEYADHPFIVEVAVPLDPPDEPVAPATEQEPPPDDKDALRARAEAMGIVVDKRWGIPRMKAEIAAHEVPTGTDQPSEPPEQVAAE